MPQLQGNDVVLYLGDYDLSGGHIEANTKRVLEQAVGSLDWDRVALTETQVRDNNLPVIIKRDKRRSKTRFERVLTQRSKPKRCGRPS